MQTPLHASHPLFTAMLEGALSEAESKDALLALNAQPFDTALIASAASAMRAKMRRVVLSADAPLLDVCGTGGDGMHSLNISTSVAFVVAACGVPVAKHGGRAVSSQSGSTDVLAALGIATPEDEASLQKMLDEANLCFLAAPLFHPALRHIAPVRAALKCRTLFNVMGPLCNPAGVTHHLLGVYDAALCLPVAEALRALGSESAWVVHGEDGMDELSVSAPTHVAELKDGHIREFTVMPEEAGLARHAASALAGGDAAQNAKALTALLSGALENKAYRDAVLLNSAAALMVADKADDLASGAALAAEAIDSGRALAALNALRNPLE